MMETNFQRRAAGHAGQLGSIGSAKGSLSPKGTIKKKKQDRKSKERQAQEICNLNVLIGRLEDRDTQQLAFATLIESLPGLNPSMVKEVYSLIEKNKKPGRSSTRRMLVLLIAALCRCHPVQAAKLLPRILSYACLRLRDRHAKTTDACVILASSIALYVLPCPTVSLPGVTSPRRQHGDSSTQQPFEAVAAVFAKEANAVGEAATRCLCGLLHPVDFDGVSVPGPSTILAHATRIRPFFKTLLVDTVAKMDGSTMFATFSPLFLLLQSTCQLARDAHEKGSFPQLGDDLAPYIASIYEAIEDAFQCGPRDDWMLRKRGLELLTLLLDIFVLQESAWCASVGAAKEYFQSHLERVRALVLAGRHDSVSPVREAAIPAVMAFECLENLYPQASGGLRSSASVSYDFVPPNPPGYSFTGKRWAKPVLSNAHDSHTPAANEAKELPPLSPSASTEDAQFFGDLAAGDEALPSHEANADEDEPTPLKFTKQAPLVRARSGNQIIRATTPSIGTASQGLPQRAESTQDDERFTELFMDQAAAPEDGDDVEHQSSQDDTSSEDQRIQAQRRGSSVHRVALGSSVAEQIDKPARSIPSATGITQAVTTLKQFAAKQRAQTRSRRFQYQDIPQISLPKRRSPHAIDKAEVFRPSHDNNAVETVLKQDDSNTASSLELSRAEATLEAAQCGEYELAFRLCIVEDDLELLRRTMSMIKTPCMATLSSMARNALCTALLSLLDGDEGEGSSDAWLALQWLQQWAAEVQNDRRQFEQLDSRVAQALSSKLNDMAMTSTKSSFAAAHVVFLLGI
ncbi:hypothetical protein PHYPSEUDO_001556 [Phytophthora pseudosyringae]|uniref:TORTIFOLIA1/SINE1-2 N-terminal domain-containing protein n=1 Tax=Phytophthora pseudosyringae TaxID=221518 RepID=A0A8T1VVV5_9STRA|nr:hypothetical protein PHYPSEUDO_001556 [Phytophthora pseudosyringae]